jgi:hypothetical protein
MDKHLKEIRESIISIVEKEPVSTDLKMQEQFKRAMFGALCLKHLAEDHDVLFTDCSIKISNEELKFKDLGMQDVFADFTKMTVEGEYWFKKVTEEFINKRIEDIKYVALLENVVIPNINFEEVLDFKRKVLEELKTKQLNKEDAISLAIRKEIYELEYEKYYKDRDFEDKKNSLKQLKRFKEFVRIHDVTMTKVDEIFVNNKLIPEYMLRVEFRPNYIYIDLKEYILKEPSEEFRVKFNIELLEKLEEKYMERVSKSKSRSDLVLKKLQDMQKTLDLLKK